MIEIKEKLSAQSYFLGQTNESIIDRDQDLDNLDESEINWIMKSDYICGHAGVLIEVEKDGERYSFDFQGSPDDWDKCVRIYQESDDVERYIDDVLENRGIETETDPEDKFYSLARSIYNEKLDCIREMLAGGSLDFDSGNISEDVVVTSFIPADIDEEINITFDVKRDGVEYSFKFKEDGSKYILESNDNSNNDVHSYIGINFGIKSGGKDYDYKIKDLNTKFIGLDCDNDKIQSNYIDLIEEVNSFIDSGTDLDIEDEGGDTAFLIACNLIACNKGHTEVMSLLLKAGADINYKDVYGCTALINAIKKDEYKTAEILINKGADCLLQNKEGKSALDIIKKREIGGGPMTSLLEKKIMEAMIDAEPTQDEIEPQVEPTGPAKTYADRCALELKKLKAKPVDQDYDRAMGL